MSSFHPADTIRLKVTVKDADALTVLASQITVAVGDSPFVPLDDYTAPVGHATVGANTATGPLPPGAPPIRVHYEIPPLSWTETIPDVIYVEA